MSIPSSLTRSTLSHGGVVVFALSHALTRTHTHSLSHTPSLTHTFFQTTTLRAMFAVLRRFQSLWMFEMDHDPLAGAPRPALRQAL